MTKTISVKAKHIKKGIPGACLSCPVALALKDAGLEDVAVFGDYFRYNPDPLSVSRVVLSRSAIRFISKFDDHGKKSVKPFNFKLEGV